uniref:H/ACA snoRNP protein NHP2 n=1 Tax=Nicoletia phytophila TaxID=1350298 RepID=A0A481SX77_9INSE|nr:putative NHP2 protein [Nicoletia phytophila]
MGKSKKEKKNDEEQNGDTSQVTGEERELTYEEKLNFVSVIAKPMAPRKLTKKLYKVIKKATKQKTYLRQGLKDVQGRIRRGERGIVIFAGDVTPIEMMCHLPAVCEDKDIPYIYTPSRMDLGSALGVKRGCLMVMVRQHKDYQELYDECMEDIKCIPLPL